MLYSYVCDVDLIDSRVEHTGGRGPRGALMEGKTAQGEAETSEKGQAWGGLGKIGLKRAILIHKILEKTVNFSLSPPAGERVKVLYFSFKIVHSSSHNGFCMIYSTVLYRFMDMTWGILFCNILYRMYRYTA